MGIIANYYRMIILIEYNVCMRAFFIWLFIHSRLKDGVSVGTVYAMMFCILVLVFVDILLIFSGTYERMFTKFRTNEQGIQIYGLFVKKRFLKWEDVTIYGTTQLLIFISTDESETVKMNRKEQEALTEKHCVFSRYSDKIFNELTKYMPDDIKNNLIQAQKDDATRVFARHLKKSKK